MQFGSGPRTVIFIWLLCQCVLAQQPNVAEGVSSDGTKQSSDDATRTTQTQGYPSSDSVPKSSNVVKSDTETPVNTVTDETNQQVQENDQHQTSGLDSSTKASGPKDDAILMDGLYTHDQTRTNDKHPNVEPDPDVKQVIQEQLSAVHFDINDIVVKGEVEEVLLDDDDDDDGDEEMLKEDIPEVPLTEEEMKGPDTYLTFYKIYLLCIILSNVVCT